MLIRKECLGASLWGVWKIEESTDQLLSILNDTSELLEFREKTRSENRLREKAAVRVLLKELLEEEPSIGYKDSGKPFLKNTSLQISISHTKGYAAVIVSPIAVGIDIEHISDRVKRVESMFINSYEYVDSAKEIQHLLLHWSAKETVYKALNKVGIDFKTDFTIQKFAPLEQGILCAVENYTSQDLKFNIQYYVEEDYVLTLLCHEIQK